jgi:hypothetical protein
VVLGLTRDDVDLDHGDLSIGLQLQRVGRKLLHRETKTRASEATLPLPSICVTALHSRLAAQEVARAATGPAWQGSKLVLTTTAGTQSTPATLSQ